MKAGTSSIWKRLGWFVAIWAASVLSLAVVALLLRLILKSDG
ncbi:DUF2474 family protein [Rhizobium sp. BR 314]